MPVIPRPCSTHRKSRSSSAEAGTKRPPSSVAAEASSKPLRGPRLISQPSPPRTPPYTKGSSSTGHGPVLVYQYPPPKSSWSSHHVQPPAVMSPPPTRPRSPPIPRSPQSPRSQSSPTDEEPKSCCIMDRIEKKYQESSSQLDGQHLYIVLCFQSAIATILFLVFLLVPLAMITVGSMNLSNCKLSYGIPLSLTIAGCAYFMIPLLSAALDWNASNSYCPVCISILVIVALTSSTAGSVLVFKEVWPSGKPDDPRYCHPALYYFSFVMWSTYVIFIPAMIVVSVVVFRKFGRHNVHAATSPPSSPK